jgi:hypothetical protein
MALKSIGGLWLNRINQVYFGSITMDDRKVPIMVTPAIETPVKGPSYIINQYYVENNKVMIKKLGALWTKVKNNKTFFTGKVMEGDLEISIMGFFNNNRTDSNNQPNINLVINTEDSEGNKKKNFPTKESEEDPFEDCPF